MKSGRKAQYSSRQMRFAEGAVLFVLILAVTVFVGAKIVATDGDDAETVAGEQARIQTAGAVADMITSAPAGVPADPPAMIVADSDPLQETNDAAQPTEVEPETAESATISYATAEAAYFEARYDDAVEMFTAYANLHPENAWGHYMLGLSFWKSGSPDSAEKAFTEALSLRPDHVKSLVNLGRVLIEQDRADEAVSLVEKAVQLAPESSDAYRVLGRVYHNLKRNEEAVSAYRKLISRDLDDVWALNNLGLILIESSQFEAALAPLARAVSLRSEEACIQNNLGVALERCGRYDLAGAAYEAALQADANYDKAELSLARVEGLEESSELAELDLAALAEQYSVPPATQEDSDPTLAEIDQQVAAAATERLTLHDAEQDAASEFAEAVEPERPQQD